MPASDSIVRKLTTREPLPRVAPHNIEAEQALLGAILINNEAFYRVQDFLEPHHFLESIHQSIFEIAGTIIRQGKVATTVTLKTFFPDDLDISGLNINQYLAHLAAESTTIINAEDYGRVVHDLAVRRELIKIGEEMVNLAYDAPVDASPRTHVEEAERKLYEVAEVGRFDAGFQSFSHALTTAVDMAARAYQREEKLSGLATGLKDLDALLGGLQKSDLVIIAGRPGMGKTALATNIAYNIANSFEPETKADGTIEPLDGGRVGFFSLEMSAEQLATRIVSEQTEISSSTIRRGGITEAEFEKLVAFSRTMQHLPLHIDETGGISISQLAARARRLKRQRGLDLLVVDYIQLIQGSSRRAREGRVQEVTEITTGLKALAKQLNIPIVALSQLSRQVEARDDKRPQLSDLRESGSIEQDADVVMFVYRDAYYLSNAEPREHNSQEHGEWQAKFDKVKFLAEVIIGKQRHGPTGTVPLHFNGRYTRFADAADSSRLPERFE
jgi:replicative DNA helicase